ncbi:DUF1295-domain-containing protein [Roridomyces roridus]|uniref:DUF1295-domain-containing protein n=1 Tax=Roridomyces roridus TaxID=1738132 RepID=A0AAD7G2P2_9AGAR|nr:DUF1295-domain-containing protein [Roridomyces roridus]
MSFSFSVPPGFEWPAQFCLFVTVATYVLSLPFVTNNVSQVDRLWTFLPTIYTAYWAMLPLWPAQQPFYLAPWNSLGVTEFNPRALLLLGLIITWMFRLSYNTYRRGLFSLNDEDYRWQVLRGQLHPVLFQITNLTFIAGIQNVLLLLLGVPAYMAATQPYQPLNSKDYAVAALTVIVLVLEFTADNQQYAYQTFKHNSKRFHATHQWPGAQIVWTDADRERGFVTRGLWAWSRHPNFALEQSFWWIMNLAALPDTTSFNLSDAQTVLDLLRPITPALSLSLLFFSSTLFSESITASKYPGYASYQARVGMFSPLDTLLKGFLLGMRGKKGSVDKELWGDVVAMGKMQ